VKALIDGDILPYRIGFTTEDVDVNIAVWRLKTLIDDILDACEADDYLIFLSSEDKSNFRYEVSSDYKANRTTPKPRHYYSLRNHIINNYKHEIVFGMEADDALGIAQNENTIIVSIDKDLNQVPGKHYNFVKKEHYVVSELEGLQWFYQQLLMGDKGVDNIEGIYGIGPKKAYAAIAHLETEEEMYEKALGMWADAHPDDYQERIIKAGQLLKIRQSEKEGLWQPPKIDTAQD
jgi:5'-3' exonuclease